MDRKPTQLEISIGEFKYDKSWYSLSEEAQDKVAAFVKELRLPAPLSPISDTKEQIFSQVTGGEIMDDGSNRIALYFPIDFMRSIGEFPFTLRKLAADLKAMENK